jgi:16S rRNA (guanine527-N7)-methyltransferase
MSVGSAPNPHPWRDQVNSREFQERLARRARHAKISIGEDLAKALEVYFQLLAKWNNKINLSGLRLEDPEPAALDRLLIEPLLAARHADGVKSMIDVGSGGGSPAIPMALALAPVRLVMVESKTRKSVFLQEAVRELALEHTRVANARYETLLADATLHERHDLLTVRAVRVSAAVLNAMQAFVKPGGHLMLFQTFWQRGSRLESGSSTPPRSSHRLIDSLQSRIVILEKRNTGANVPRGTSRAAPKTRPMRGPERLRLTAERTNPRVACSSIPRRPQHRPTST